MALALLLAGLAGTLNASSGLVGALGRAETKDHPAKRFDGWDAGFLVVAPDQGSFWRFTYGQAKGDKVPLAFSSAEGRLAFATAGKGPLRVYTGAGGGIGWLKQDGKVSRTGLWSGFAGVILFPDRAVTWLWRDFPCWTCIFNRATFRCRSCLMQREGRGSGTADSPPPVLIGAEAGYRKAGQSLSGPEYRVWLGLIF